MSRMTKKVGQLDSVVQLVVIKCRSARATPKI